MLPMRDTDLSPQAGTNRVDETAGRAQADSGIVSVGTVGRHGQAAALARRVFDEPTSDLDLTASGIDELIQKRTATGRHGRRTI